MGLLVVYIVIVLVGQALNVAIGLSVDEYVNKGVGLITFLALFFAVLVVSWPIAVRVSRPKTA